MGARAPRIAVLLVLGCAWGLGPLSALDTAGGDYDPRFLEKKLEPDAFFRPLSPPVFLAAEETLEAGRTLGLKDDDWCVVTDRNGPRIYPVPVLIWHEAANDRPPGLPGQAVTYCILTDSAVVFGEDFGERGKRDFGVSGYLYQSNLVLFDYQTRSTWSQALARGMSGPGRGQELSLQPYRFMKWSEAKALPEARLCAGTDSAAAPRTRYTRAPMAALESYPEDDALRAAVDPEALADDRFAPKDRFVYFPRSRVALSFQGLASRDHPLVQTVRREGKLVSLTPVDEPFITLYWFGLRAFYPQAEVVF